MTNYKFWEDEPFCKNHYPVTGFGDHSAKHVSGTVETNSKHLESQLNAPKLDTVNQTVRGPQDIKPTTTVDSIGIANALKAPKSTPYNQTVRARFCVSCGKAAEGVATNSCPGCGNYSFYNSSSFLFRYSSLNSFNCPNNFSVCL